MSSIFDTIREGDEYKFLTNGEWVRSRSGETIDIISPIDGSIAGRVQAVAREEIDEMLTYARNAQKEWAKFSLEDRAALLNKAAELVDDHIDEMVTLKVYEIGKTKKKAHSDIKRAGDIVRYTAQCLDIAHGAAVLSAKDFPEGGDKKIAHISRHPLGVILAITPFNYPINLAATKLAPALLAGNAVVLKSATQGALSGAHFAELFRRAGIPHGVINFVTGRGSNIGDYLIAHKDIAMINFTGSTETGHHIAAHAGMKPLLLELGGKDAALVLPDADIDRAAKQIVDGAFGYSGQRCTAIKRVLVHEKAHDDLVTKIVEMTKEKYSAVGDPRKDGITIGPVISLKQADYITELIDDAVKSGAKVVVGGQRDKNYIHATVLDGVTEKMRIAWEEQFGPALPVITVRDEEEMIHLHNKSQYGLGASIFTKDIEYAHELARKLEVGVVQINGKSERFPDSFPFLGIKDSGLGTQGIRWSIEAMSRIKSVVENK